MSEELMERKLSAMLFFTEGEEKCEFFELYFKGHLRLLVPDPKFH